MPPPDPFRAASALLSQIGLPPPTSCSPLPGGRNNFVWVVKSHSQQFLLKRYFWSEQDPRDRMGQEWAFLDYLRHIGCGQVPEPLAKDSANRCALMEFIEGKPIGIQDVTPADVEAAAGFFAKINQNKSGAINLQPVSEACFTLGEHLATVADRMRRLRTIEASDPASVSAREMVSATLEPLWHALETSICSQEEIHLAEVLPLGQRCLSPSDFGFHNALRQNDGSLRFLDFEYAGWDDPAKTIIDFCNQPDGLLPRALGDIFRKRAIGTDPDLAARIRLLEPLYQLKWACICLNSFLPGRTFAGALPGRSPSDQLRRAATMADRASRSNGNGFHRTVRST